MYQSLELWHNKTISWLSQNDFQQEENHVVIKAIYSLISLGTERLLTTQNLNNDTATKMRVPYMKGHFHTPFTYGYSLIGKVIVGPAEVKEKVVHLMHPHQNILAARQEDVTIIPEELNPKTAALASNMETAVNAIWDGDVQLGDKVLVIGFGIIGALISALAKQVSGIDVTVAEPNPNKQPTITRSGHLLYSDKGASDYDIVFNTSASADMLQKALNLTQPEGRIVEVSWYGDKKIELNLGGDFHYGRKQIISSQVSQIPNRKKANWDYNKRKQLVFKLLKDLDLSHLIEEEIRFEDSPKFYEQLRNGSINSLGVVIKY